MKSKIGKTSKWLLLWMAKSQYPAGITRVTKLPLNAEPGVGMPTLMGLVKRGWVEDRNKNGIYYLTSEGFRVAKAYA